MIILFLFLQVDSLSLNQAIDYALAESPAYNESRASLSKVRIQFYQSLSNLLPTITTQARYTKSNFQGFVTNSYTGSINLNVPIFDIDVIGSIILSKERLNSNQISYKAEIARMILNLKAAYYKLINARELLKASEITIKHAQENLKLLKTKYELGSASRLEKLQAEVFYLRALENKANAIMQEISAQEELKSILGIEHNICPTDSLTPPDSITLPALDSILAIIDRANFDIRSAQELTNIARTGLVLSYLAFLPKVSFFYGYSANTDSLIFDFQYYKDNHTTDYGISISLPLFEIKTLIFNWLTARKEYHIKKFSRKRVELESRKALRISYYTLKGAIDKLRYAQRALEAANEAATIAREQFRLGAISLLDLLQTEEDLYDAKVSFNSALENYYSQKANFSYLAGEFVLNKE